MAMQDLEYNRVVNQIRNEGVVKGDRTGTGTTSVFGTRMEFDLSGNKIPLLTTKKVFHKGIIHELVWMLSGNTNIRYLKANNVSIWDSWIDPKTAEYVDITSQEHIDWMKKTYPDLYDQIHEDLTGKEKALTEEAFLQFINYKLDIIEAMQVCVIPRKKLVGGVLPNIYQHQWRMWDDTRIVTDAEVDDYEVKGYTIVGNIENTGGPTSWVVQRKIDQIANVIQRLKDKPDCRRLIVNAWNVAEIDEMALPPCHAMFQFWTRELDTDERYALLPDNVRWADDMSSGVHELCDIHNVPKRAISCQLYQR